MTNKRAVQANHEKKQKIYKKKLQTVNIHGSYVNISSKQPQTKATSIVFGMPLNHSKISSPEY